MTPGTATIRQGYCVIRLSGDKLVVIGGLSVDVDEKTRKRIDDWIERENRNPYGDERDTVYMGGTPLFNEMTGKSKDRYEYILEKHPELGKD